MTKLSERLLRARPHIEDDFAGLAVTLAQAAYMLNELEGVLDFAIKHPRLAKPLMETTLAALRKE